MNFLWIYASAGLILSSYNTIYLSRIVWLVERVNFCILVSTMLMKKSYEFLMDLCLSRAHFILAKTVAYNSEKIARFKCHKNLLKRCIEHRLFPPTIDNLHLPTCFSLPIMRGVTSRLKMLILKKMIRFTSAEMGRLIKVRDSLNTTIRALDDEAVRHDILRLQYLAFGNVNNFLFLRNSKRLTFWLRKRNARTLPVMSEANDDNTDASAVGIDAAPYNGIRRVKSCHDLIALTRVPSAGFDPPVRFEPGLRAQNVASCTLDRPRHITLTENDDIHIVSCDTNFPPAGFDPPAKFEPWLRAQNVTSCTLDRPRHVTLTENDDIHIVPCDSNFPPAEFDPPAGFEPGLRAQNVASCTLDESRHGALAENTYFPTQSLSRIRHLSSSCPSLLSLNTRVSGDIPTKKVEVSTSRTTKLQSWPTDGAKCSHMVTDLTGELTEVEKALLSKGPRFRLTASLNSTTVLDLQSSLCRLSYQLKWASVSVQNGNDETVEKFPRGTELFTPPHNGNIDAVMRLVAGEMSRALRQHHDRSNLTMAERQTLKSLKEKDIVCLPSDKGGEFCVIKRAQFVELGLTHLNDATTYEPIRHIQPRTIETKINKAWNDVCSGRDVRLSHRVQRSYTANNTRIPQFYHLIKTHKLDQRVRVRPIVSCIGGPGERISHLLTRILTPLLSEVPAHLSDSYDLMSRIQRIPKELLNDCTYLFSLDVISLYTVIPAEQAVHNILSLIDLSENFNSCGFSTNDLGSLLKVVLTNTYFCFDNSFYKQISGLAMGLSVSPILAITYMHTLESRALSRFNVRLYARYVDDAFFMCSTEDEADDIFEAMNSVDSNIKFEMEKPKTDGSISLLDFNVVNTGEEVRFDFYQKSARSPVFVHYESAIPLTQKLSILRNERQRILSRCSSEHRAAEHLTQFEKKLRINGYPEHIIAKLRHPQRHSNLDSLESSQQPMTSTTAAGRNQFFFKMPHFSDRVFFKFRNIFKRHNLPVTVVPQARSLRSILYTRPGETNVCKFSNCLTASDNICFRTNVVYQIECTACSRIYIGSTIRFLHIRIREHMRQQSSTVFLHNQKCSASCLKVTILAHAMDPKNVRMKEAILIEQHAPQLNRKAEMVDVKALTSCMVPGQWRFDGRATAAARIIGATHLPGQDSNRGTSGSKPDAVPIS